MKKSLSALFLGLAVSLGMVSCGEDSPNTGNTTVVLSSNKTQIVSNGTDVATFTVMVNGEDKTNSAVIKSKTETLTSNTFSTSVAGTYEFRATVDNVNSNVVTIKAEAEASEAFLRKTGVIYVTSTGCTFCPIGSKVVQAAKKDYAPMIVPMYFHAKFGMPDDPFVISQTNDMKSWMNVESTAGLPVMNINNKKELFNGSFDKGVFLDYTLGANKKSSLGLAISSEYNSATRELKCTLKTKTADDTYANKNLYMVAWLLQDNLMAAQLNQGVTESDYMHNDVVRASVLANSVNGIAIPKEKLAAGVEFTQDATITIDQSWTVDNEDFFIVFYVYDIDAKKDILNIQRVKIGENIDFITTKLAPRI